MWIPKGTALSRGCCLIEALRLLEVIQYYLICLNKQNSEYTRVLSMKVTAQDN